MSSVKMETKATGSKPGRRPKKAKDVVENKPTDSSDVVISHVETKPEKKTKKKTPQVVAMVSSSGIIGSFLSEQRPLIAHLPVRSDQLLFETSNILADELKYDPSIPDVPKPAEAVYDNYVYIEKTTKKRKE